MSVVNDNAWQTAVVAEVAPAAEGVAEITLVPQRPIAAPPGSHLQVRVPGLTTLRSYSVVASEDQGARLTIAVRLDPTSRGGSAYMHRLAAGDRLQVTQPRLDFPLNVNAPAYLLLAGGIGITPIVSMADTLRRRRADYRIVYAGRSRAAMPYLERLAEQHGDRLSVHVDDEGTRVDLASLVDGVAASGAAGLELYMCGPVPMMEAVNRGWREAGLPVSRLRFETFANSGSYPAEAFTVAVPRLGVEVTVPPDTTILDALEASGTDVMFDCRRGECGLCVARVLDTTGAIDHRDVFFSPEQKAAGDRLCMCVSRVAHAAGDPAGDAPRITLDLP